MRSSRSVVPVDRAADFHRHKRKKMEQDTEIPVLLIGVGGGSVVVWLLLLSQKLVRVSRDSKGEIELIKWSVVSHVSM